MGPSHGRSSQREGFVFLMNDDLAFLDTNDRGVPRRPVGLFARSYRCHAEFLEESSYS